VFFRYVIYVKEGVYEEYVTITKKMANVTMYGDGSKKTIITGNRNFVDGLTTYKTATFSKSHQHTHCTLASPSIYMACTG
jgi:pectin methylesterase-like acyl-CoA thioesterase